VPEKDIFLWTLWCKAGYQRQTPTIHLGATPSGPMNANLHHPTFLWVRCPSCHPTMRCDCKEDFHLYRIYY